MDILLRRSACGLLLPQEMPGHEQADGNEQRAPSDQDADAAG
jgi:hypothetical protein